MKWLGVWLVAVAAWGAPARYARVGDYDGDVAVQLQAADDWRPAIRNMPVSEQAWLRTGASARVEIELDEGSVLRLGANSLAEISDYTRLSTGQRITLIWLDHGVAYLTGAADGNDSLTMAVPGAQVTIHQAAKVRLEAAERASQIAAGEGGVRFSSPTAEFDLSEGQLARIDPAQPARFSIQHTIPALDSDRWCDERDKVLASTTSAAHAPGLRYGLADLDASGVWIQSSGLGAVWKPKAASSWVPYRNGKWDWYDGLGYTWISADSWGWLPYHYGRWMLDESTGWVWSPGPNTVFKPAEVYWLKSAKLVGWGPLAPGETWQPPDVPRLFLNANTTYAEFAPDTREIDPAGFASRPKEPLATAVFAVALPSPSFPAARLDATRPLLHSPSSGVVPVVDGVTYTGQPVEAAADTPPPPPAPAAQDAAQTAETPVAIVNTPPVDAPPDPYYPVPIYTGIIVVTPPQRQVSGSVVNAGKTTAPASGAEPAPKPHPDPPRRKPADGEKGGR